MAGKIRQTIDDIIDKQAKKTESLVGLIQAKMLLMGVNPKLYTMQSPDDPQIIAKLEKLKNQFTLSNRG
jgi:hypothetical protein